MGSSSFVSSTILGAYILTGASVVVNSSILWAFLCFLPSEAGSNYALAHKSLSFYVPIKNLSNIASMALSADSRELKQTKAQLCLDTILICSILPTDSIASLSLVGRSEARSAE
jgi:hypothetical protein